MLFEPINSEHAIVEAVVGLQLATDVKPDEVNAIIAAHDKFKEELPRLGRTSAIQFMVGGEMPFTMPAAMQVGGFTFDRFKADGNLDWRLRVEGNSIFVNCLSYDSWSNVWKKARSFIERVADYLDDEAAVAGMLVQYIDVFKYQPKNGKYDLAELFDKGSPFIPKALWGHGELWHLHQGWYKEAGLPIAKRMLERIHIEGIPDANNLPTVKFDSWHSVEFKEPHVLRETFKKELDETFAFLHQANLDVIKGTLTKSMAKRIGLDA